MQEERAHTFPNYRALLNAVVAELYDHKWFYSPFMPENWENQLSNRWKNTKAVLAWFTGIQHKELHSFVALDVVEFYPLISIDLLAAALEFASKHVTICDDEWHIILQAKSSLLYNSGEPWSKRTSSNLFDVTMGSFDGTESCELVGTYLLHNIKDRFDTACLACTEITV